MLGDYSFGEATFADSAVANFLSPAAGVFSLAGESATFTKALHFFTAAGIFTLSGKTISCSVGHFLAAGFGQYQLISYPVVLNVGAFSAAVKAVFIVVNGDQPLAALPDVVQLYIPDVVPQIAVPAETNTVISL